MGNGHTLFRRGPQRLVAGLTDRPGGFLSPFRHETYRRLWLANLGSYFGGIIQMTGAAWMMTTLTEDRTLVALVQASTTLPFMLFSLIAGAVADNYNRRRIMMGANGFMFSVSVLLLVATLSGTMTPWLLLSFTFLIGCGSAMIGPAWQASVGDLVPREDLPGAVTLNSVCFNLSRSLAPALGGVIIAWLGVMATFATNALSYIGLIIVLAGWKMVPARDGLPRERIGRSVKLGLRYVSMSPNLLRVLGRGFVFGLGAVGLLALLPLVAREVVQGGPKTYGLMLGAFGVGGLLGAAMNTKIRRWMSNEWIARTGFLLSAFAALMTVFSTHHWLTGLGLVLGGAAWVITLSLLNTTVQLSSPRWVVGRALSIYQMSVFAGFAGGSWLWGWVAQTSSVQTALEIVSIMLLGGAAIGLKRPLPESPTGDLDPSGVWKEPALAMELQPSSGPIVIEAEFRIREEDIPEFLSTMEERRRARIRDGAHHWSLTRDLQAPEQWRISYQFPTWLEYVRHNRRLTKEDSINSERILALHQGPEPPKIRRMIERQTIVIPPVPMEV